MAPILIIILIIFFAGLLGGVTNFFLLWSPEVRSGENQIGFYKSVLMGLCASIAVPLFLQVLPNSLLDMGEEMPFKNYFILAGLCVLAAFYSKRFLEDLYDRVSKAEKTAEEAKKAVEDNEQQNMEIEDINEVADEIVTKYNPVYSQKEIRDIANAVLNTTYSYRTIHGISEDTVNDDNKVREILELLKQAGYVESMKTRKGSDMWKSLYTQKK
jgi:hypothetical protein